MNNVLTADSISAGGGTPSGSAVGRKDLLRHRHKLMGSLQAASHIEFRGTPNNPAVGIVGSVWDAARLGSPAKELLMHVIWSGEKNVASVLPPAVSPV